MQETPPHIDAAERLSRLRPPSAIDDWSKDQFVAAAAEGKRRWSEAQELFGKKWRMFEDAVSVISPSFGLESRYSDIANAVEVKGPSAYRLIALWFMRWARCPATAEYPNPYEPWIEIWEHGGSFRVEHGTVVDIFNASQLPIGGISASPGNPEERPSSNKHP